MLRLVLSLVVGVLVVGAPASARAYAIQSVISTGCHERISMNALHAVRGDTPAAEGLAPATEDDRALVADLPFEAAPEFHELYAASLLIGNRDNDLKGNGAAELDHLALVHGNPENQREHCLRSRGDDEPNGTASALAACKAFIRERVNDALDGLDAAGKPDPGVRTKLHVALAIRGGVDVTLPRYWVAIGQAMHTVQDSFAHSFRSVDRTKVRASLNWIDWVERDEIESRDGPVHRNELDECDGLDALRQRNFDVATEASAALLRATLDSTKDRAAKLAAVDALLDGYLGEETGCSAANGWCDAPERSYAVTPGCGCALVGVPTSKIAIFAAILVLGVLVGRRRRAIVVGVALLVLPATASADEEPPQPTTVVEAVVPVKTPPRKTHWGVYGAVSGSVTNPAFNGQLGLRLRLSERWVVGVDGELNNWFAVHTSELRTGAFNGYFTGIFRYPLRFEKIDLRTTVNLGTSVLLIDLYGAPRSSVGIYAGIAPLGVEWNVAEHVYLVFDPLGVALPVPNLKGVPFAYPQYRTSFGVELSY